MTKAEASEVKATEAEATEKRTTVKASEMFEPVSKVLAKAGAEGISLAQLSEQTGIRARVLHNVLFRLEEAEKVRRLQEDKGKKVLYASTEVKAPRSRRSITKKATTKAA